MFNLVGMGSSQATPRQQKDFRKLESALIKGCTNQCMRRDRHYDTESEMCMAKCFDLAFIYTRIGLTELN